MNHWSRIIVFVVVVAVMNACMQQQPVKRLEDLSALKGKTSHEVCSALGVPAVIDSSASEQERIWGYYRVMVRSETDAKPRQRTVLIVLRKHEKDFIVEEVRIP